MSSTSGHRHSASMSQNHRAQLAHAYNELGKELASSKIRVVGNYTLGKVIGEGTYGKVRIGTHRLTSTRVAIKQIPKAMSASLTREIHHHRQLHHPHIAQMYEVIATESAIWIVTELCCGGELFDYLVEKGRLTEDETRIIFGQLCLAVAYLHDSGIVHRDLKLENVLLDERCRVKLGDFGFTREYDKNTFMETFCGTTGYASPEMLQGKRYQGPEVDVWSLGVILYCLLTGTLPFDDDDERAMRAKIIKGEFEDPVWLSLEARDLITKILQKDVTKRLTIPQIFAHPWFTSSKPSYEGDSPTSSNYLSTNSSNDCNSQTTSETSTQDSESQFNNRHDAATSTPTTPDDVLDDPFLSAPVTQSPSSNLHRSASDSTIGKASDNESLSLKIARAGERQPAPVPEEGVFKPTPSPQPWSKGPSHPIRTPVRTKRRSISSSLSDPSSPVADKISTPLPVPSAHDLDFASLLSQPTPIIFSTPLERDLLNTLSSLGFDTGQVVHSVLTNACDSAGAVWWMLKKRAERKALESEEPPPSATEVETPRAKDYGHQKKKRKKVTSSGVQTEGEVLARSAPKLAFVPATPTLLRPLTPPRQHSPTRSPMLSPSSSTITGDLSSRSHPSTPAGSLKDRDKDKGRKPRSGSVSIMQRATTALEAAGLVRKKSSEVVKDKEEKEREKSRDEPRTSHSSGGSNKLTKSPKISKEYPPVPVTPPPNDQHHTTANVGSPWVLAESKESLPRMNGVTPLTVGGQIQTQTTSNISETARAKRANLLTTFRLWFNENGKGKRKEPVSASLPNSAASYMRPMNQPVSGGTGKRRGSTSSGKFRTSGHGHRTQRPSMSSRRSSSVNSRRSSMVMADSPQISTRRSFGSHTPNSDRGEYSSRPSSVRSLSMQPLHRKSPSASSVGSAHFRAASPMKYHRRGGSGSSTRVVRQIQPNRGLHARSNSAASSIHSPPSSRPTSFYEPSESEGTRTASPFKMRKRSGDRMASGSTLFVQKRQSPFVSPMSHAASFGRSSWKKSWGLEPPGWQTRTKHLPVEVLAISPVNDSTTIRDVFSGRQPLNPGDESDWVDEDEDVPAFAGGLGQMGVSQPTSSGLNRSAVETAPMLSPAPKGNRRSAKRNNNRVAPGSSSNGTASMTSAGMRGKGMNEGVSPAPQEETRVGRRQLPTGRSGPAFRQAIQEEDEDEEE